jgi:hypothetical protein
MVRLPFRDFGAVGRVPYLVPVKWEDGWPVLGVNGKVPDTLDLPGNKSLMPGIISSDEFTGKRENRVYRLFGNGIITPTTPCGLLPRVKVICALPPVGWIPVS